MRQLSTDLRRPDSYTNNTTNENGTPCRRRYKRPHLPPLFYAVQARNWDTALRRSQTHPHEIVTVEDSSGDTPLHYACRLNPTQDVVRALLAASRDVNHEGATPLHVAASHRCSAQVIRILVQMQMPSATVSTRSTNTRTKHKPLTLSLTKQGRTPLHYACLSFRGLNIEAFEVLLQATIDACSNLQEQMNHSLTSSLEDDLDAEDDLLDDEWWEMTDVTEMKVNAFTMQDRMGYTPLSLLFRRYRERVKCVIRMLEGSKTRTSRAAATAVQDELGELWLKALLIVSLMSKRQVRSNTYTSNSTAETSEALEAASWSALKHQQIEEDDDIIVDGEDGSEMEQGRKFRLVHASVGLTGYGCPPEMLRLAISVYPNQVKEMDEDGNLPLHIAAIASSFIPTTETSSTSTSDEDTFISNLSNFSGFGIDSKPFHRVIKMLLRGYPFGAQVPNGKTGQLPLILAIEAKKRKYEDGLRALLEAYPAALESREISMRLYPNILSLIGKPKEKKSQTKRYCKTNPFLRKKKEESTMDQIIIPNALFEIIRAKPSIVGNGKDA